MKIEEQILDELIRVEFNSLIEKGIKIRWLSNRRSKNNAKILWGWPLKFVAFVRLKEKFVYLNRRFKRSLRKHRFLLREILRHELLHLETNLGEEPLFRQIAAKRNINVGLEFKDGRWVLAYELHQWRTYCFVLGF